jgi:hypothetical protein
MTACAVAEDPSYTEAVIQNYQARPRIVTARRVPLGERVWVGELVGMPGDWVVYEGPNGRRILSDAEFRALYEAVP